MIFNEYMDVLPEIKEALENNKPVVALETTTITHEVPYPRNKEVAKEIEHLVREHGAVPATIAIVQGRIKVGLDDETLEYISKKGPKVTKSSRRDLALILAKGMDGATTVTTTMMIAEMAGIRTFATGGIGGVHRGAETTMDISADLEELAQTPVIVVSAGAKAILDLGLTLEYLETKGVPVVAYQTEYLPAFYTRTSKYKVDARVDTPKEIAEIFKVKQDAGIKGALLVTNPIPEAYAMNEAVMNKAIDDALIEMEKAGISGNDSTPFLLNKVSEATGGESLEANIQLILNNAILGAKVAVEYSKLV